MTENRPFSLKIPILGNFDLQVVNQDIKNFEKVFDFLKPISCQLLFARHITIPILNFSLHLYAYMHNIYVVGLTTFLLFIFMRGIKQILYIEILSTFIKQFILLYVLC